MKQEFKNYLVDIKLSHVMMNSVLKKYNILCNAANVEEFDEIFLSEAISNTGTREYFSLWGFTENMMCKISIMKIEVSIFRIKNHISNISIDNRNFDLKTPTAESKLHYALRRTDAEGTISFSASGLNCEQLLIISKKYLLPNLNH